MEKKSGRTESKKQQAENNEQEEQKQEEDQQSQDEEQVLCPLCQIASECCPEHCCDWDACDCNDCKMCTENKSWGKELEENPKTYFKKANNLGEGRSRAPDGTLIVNIPLDNRVQKKEDIAVGNPVRGVRALKKVEEEKGNQNEEDQE